MVLHRSHVEGFRRLTKVGVAQWRFLKAVEDSQVGSELRPISEAAGRVLEADLIARRGLPSNNLSIVDGFAVRSLDLQRISSNPVVLKQIGESIPGKPCSLIVRRRQTVAVATGSIVPRGVDSVAPIEDVRFLRGSRILFSESVRSGQNIVLRGEDVSRGQVVLRKGACLRPQDLGLLKAMGIERVSLLARPRVAVISTGSELVETFHDASSGQTVDINRQILSSLVTQAGGVPVDLGIVKDRKASIVNALRKAVECSDLVLVSGGSSVGERDLIPSCVDLLGKPGMLVHGVAMRPSMPTGLAVVNGTPIISLPGFPVSAMFAFLVFGRCMICRLGGKPIVDRTVRAVLAVPVKGVKGFRTFIRVILRKTSKGLFAEPVKSQKSSVLMSMVRAEGYITIPEGVTEIPAGHSVEVTLFT
jgi:molybdopterin molybdotransferase